MKKISGILFALAAMTSMFVGCVREPEVLPSAEERAVFFTAEPIETRTAFTDPTGDSYPVLWTENDKNVLIALNMDDKNKQTVNVTPADDFKTATFVATFSAEAESYTFYALSPASALLSVASTDGRLGVTVPSAQTPTAKSVDEAAQLLIAQSSTTTSMPEKVSFSFKHWTAYGKMSLTNLTLGDAKIEAVDLTAEEPWAGRWYYYFANGTSAVNSGSNTITVNTTTANDIWFACAPVDLSGKKLTVTVKTDKGTLTKEITMPANRKFESGKIARFTVDMEGISIQESQVYELVTKAEDLLYHSQVIIAGATVDYAISTTQQGNNRAAAAVTKEGNKIIDPSSSVEVFLIEAGTQSGSFAFKTSTDQYIYAAGGTKNNYLRSKDTKDDTGSWAITFGEKTVVKALIADEGARNILQFNPNSGNPIFNCYGSNSTSRDSVALYKLVGSGESSFPTEKKESGLWLEKTALTINVGESAEVGVDYDKMDAAYFTDGGSVTFSVDDATVATVDEDGMVLGLTAGTCIVTVTAPETTNYNAATKTCTVKVNEASQGGKTIAEILALAEGKLDNTVGTGDIASDLDLGPVTVAAISGGNIIVKDATGLMMVFKNNSGLAVGDVINLSGKLQNYYGVAEFVPSGDIEKVSSGATVDHGTPVAFDEAAITAYQNGARSIKFVKVSGSLPTSKSSAYMNIGAQRVRIYNTDILDDADLGKQADVLAYVYGYHTQGYLQVIVTSYEANASAPFLTVDATSKTWAADATDAFTVNVSVETGGSWTYTASGMDWATVTKSGNTLVVTPKAANTSSTANEGTVTLTNSADASKTATVEFKQSGVVSGSSFVLDSDAIKSAHSEAWAYTSGDKTITATDGSAWVCYNTYATKGQVTVQMRPSSNSTITTPSVPSGKKITHLAVSCAWNNDGTGGFETTRTLQILDGSEVVVASVTGKDLYEGIEIPGNHTKLSFGPTASGSGTIYVLNATVTFE